MIADLVKIAVTSIGTSTLSLGDAVTGFRGVSALLDGEIYSYTIQQDAKYEYGRGTYIASGHRFARAPINSSAGGAAIDLTANAVVSLVFLGEDITQLLGEAGLVQAVKDAGAAQILAIAAAFPSFPGIVTDVTTRQADVVARQADVVARQADVVARQADVVTKQADVATKSSQVATDRAYVGQARTDASSYRDQAVAAAASVDISAISAAVAQTGADRGATHNDRLASDTNSANALSSAARAESAALAAGLAGFFLTRAAANSGFSGVTNQRAVTVNADETMGGLSVVLFKDTAINSTGYIFARLIAPPPTYYADITYGDDANSGLGPNLAVKTLARLGALLGGAVATGDGKFGACARLDRGSRWNGEVLTNLAPYCRISDYGQGGGPIVDASIPLPASWTLAPGKSYYYQDVTFATASEGAFPGANMWHCGAWDEQLGFNIADDGLPRILNADPMPDAAYNPDKPQTTSIAVTSQSALLAILDASTIGGFTVFKSGSTNYEPRNDVGTYSWRYYVKTADGTNPNTNGRTIYVNPMLRCADFSQGLIIENVTFARSGSKDGASGYYNAAAEALRKSEGSGYTLNCRFMQHGGHAFVDGGMSHFGTYTKGMYTRSPYVNGCGSFHGFRNSSAVGRTKGRIISKCRIERFGIGVYTHGDAGFQGNFDPVQAKYHDVLDCNFSDGDGVFAPGQTERAPKMLRCTGINVNTLIGPDALDKAALIEDCDFTGRDGGQISIGLVTANSTLTIRNTKVRAGKGGTLQLMLPDFRGSPVEIDPSTYPVLSLEKGTVFTGRIVSNGNPVYDQIKMKMRGTSYAGVFDPLGPTDLDVQIRGTIDADAGCRIETRRESIESIRTRFTGVQAGVETGTRLQIWSKTIAAGDLAFVPIGAGATASYSGSGSTITTSYISYFGLVGRSIKIVGGGTSGADFITRVTSVPDGYSLVVSPAPPAAFSNKAILNAILAIDPFRVPIVAYVSQDGTQINVPDATNLPSGVNVNVGKVRFSAGAFGLRKMLSRSGNVVTLDAPIVWQPRTNLQFNPITTPTGSDYARLPTVTLDWGFSFSMPIAGGLFSPTYSLAMVEGGVVSGSLTSNAVGLVDYAQGFISASTLFVAVGDVVTFTNEIDIPGLRGPTA
jgi:hypothetical protein